MYNDEVNRSALENLEQSFTNDKKVGEYNLATHERNVESNKRRIEEHEFAMTHAAQSARREIETSVLYRAQSRHHAEVQDEVCKMELRERICKAFGSMSALFRAGVSKDDGESRVARVRRLYGDAAAVLDMDIDKEIADALSEEDMNS